ncbi:MAG: arylsulfatase [Pseudomonadota bacterium]
MRRLIILLLVSVLALGFGVMRHMARDAEVAESRAIAMGIRSDTRRMPSQATSTDDPPLKRPNILLIVADDMGWRDVGYHGSEIRTPAIDELSRTGVALNRFYAHPSCSPTRAALMTGKSPLRLGIFDPLSKKNPTGLPLSETTLAKRLQKAGYQTALTGKWHLGPRNLNYHPNARGFDHFYGNLTGGVGYYDKVHGGGYDWQRNGETVREPGYTTHLIAREAMRVIEERDTERPLFLYVAFGAPHLPNEAPAATVASYSHIEDESRRYHAAMVTELDAAVGEIRESLRREGIENETLIWFMSDNGGLYPYNPLRFLPEPLLKIGVERRFGISATPLFVDFIRTNLRDGGADNRPFKGAKQSVQEGGVRVPSVIHWPATLGSAPFNQMATVQDVMPTLLQVAGIDGVPGDFDGRSLWPSLRTGAPIEPMDYLVTSNAFDMTALYRYPHKLVSMGGKLQLYNLETDPFEDDDLASQLPAIRDSMHESLTAFPRAQSIALPLQQIVDDPDYFGGTEDREPWAEQAYWPDS